MQTYYTLINAQQLIRVGHFTTHELMQAESEGYRILDDKPRQQQKKPLMRKHEEIDWSVFDMAN